MLYSQPLQLIWAMFVLIEKLPIKSIPLFMYTLVISMAILERRIVKVSMIVFEQFGHEHPVSDQQKKALEV
jgi:hypothetical protein